MRTETRVINVNYMLSDRRNIKYSVYKTQCGAQIPNRTCILCAGRYVQFLNSVGIS